MKCHTSERCVFVLIRPPFLRVWTSPSPPLESSCFCSPVFVFLRAFVAEPYPLPPPPATLSVLPVCVACFEYVLIVFHMFPINFNGLNIFCLGLLVQERTNSSCTRRWSSSCTGRRSSSRTRRRSSSCTRIKCSSCTRRRSSSCTGRRSFSCTRRRFVLVPEENHLPVQEEDHLLVQEEDLLLVQEDLLLVQEEDLLLMIRNIFSIF